MRKPLLKILVFASAFIMQLQAEAQVSLFTDGISIKFSGSEMKKFEKAAEIIGDADEMLGVAKDAFSRLSEAEIKDRSSSSYAKALDLLFKASGLYREGYGTAYEVFYSRDQDFWTGMQKTNHRASGMDKALYYERTSAANMKRSGIRHEQVLESDRFEYSLNILNDAVGLGRLAVRNAGRSAQICSDYPVEYNYGWDDDKSLEEIIKLLKDPNVNEPPADIFATVDEKQQVDSTLLKDIIFKVQIAAHTEPLTEEYLATLYKGGIKIDLIYEEDWYKYSIGRYSTFDEAEATRRECNVSKAFVVAYQEGKKISTQEAMNIAEQMQESSR